MSDPKGPFEAAVRAGCAGRGVPLRPCEFPACHSATSYCQSAERGIAVLRAALPPDPAPETRQRAADALYEVEPELSYTRCQAIVDIVHRAIRTRLLPEEEPK